MPRLSGLQRIWAAGKKNNRVAGLGFWDCDANCAPIAKNTLALPYLAVWRSKKLEILPLGAQSVEDLLALADVTEDNACKPPVLSVLQIT